MKTLLASILCLACARGDWEKLTKAATYTLSEAVDKVMKEAKEGTPVSAEIEEEGGKMIYTSDVAQGSKTLEINLDVKTGALVAKDVENADHSAIVKAVKITLKQAIDNAQKKAAGKAVLAKFVLEGAKAHAEVSFFSEGQLTVVQVSGETGEVLSNGKDK